MSGNISFSVTKTSQEGLTNYIGILHYAFVPWGYFINGLSFSGGYFQKLNC